MIVDDGFYIKMESWCAPGTGLTSTAKGDCRGVQLIEARWFKQGGGG